MLSSLLIIILRALPLLAAAPVAEDRPPGPLFRPEPVLPLAQALNGDAQDAPMPGNAPAGQASPAPASAAPQPDPARLAALAAATDRAAARVTATVQARDKMLADKAKLARQYEAQLGEIDRLKQSRASWRRDRLIRTRMSESHATAEKLAELDERLRQLGTQVRLERQALVDAIERERALGVPAARNQQLARWHEEARRHLRRSAKRIVLPDDRIDPLADPEELEYQAALIRQSEQQLAEELARLDRQADRYQHMAALRKKRSRAAELGGFDDDQPRRSTGQSRERAEAGRGDDVDSDNGASPPPSAPPPPPAPGEGEPPPTDSPPSTPAPPVPSDPGEGAMFDIILADVVDAPTLQALRAADRSTDPALKARATERAHEQVRTRLERLRERRKLIQQRAQELRNR